MHEATDHYCTEPRHLTTKLTDGDYTRCGECNGRLTDHDLRQRGIAEKSAADYLELTTRITRDGIYFGDERLPGIIEENGVSLSPGMADGFNRLTVTFLVGPVEAVDPIAEETTVEWPAQQVTRYRAPQGETAP